MYISLLEVLFPELFATFYYMGYREREWSLHTFQADLNLHLPQEQQEHLLKNLPVKKIS